MRLLLLLLFPYLLLAEVGYVEPWGKDAALSVPKAPAKIEPVRLSPMGKLAEAVIRFHHKVITQIDGPRSHFRPSSSSYMLEAIHKHGFVKGYLMGCDRLLRENGDPWHYRTKLVDGKLYKWDPPPDS